MPVHRIKKGLDLPIAGEPNQQIDEAATKCTRVAIMADDFPGMKPRMLVNEGDTVKRGQPVFEDRKNPGVFYTAPGAGRVIGVNRGAKRALQSFVVHLSESEQAGTPGADEIQKLEAHTGKDPDALSREEIVGLLVESGDWTAFRTRPFSKVPAVDSAPAAIFVNAMDTNPLAADPEVVLAERREDFAAGLKIVARLTEGKTYLCVKAGSKLGSGLDAKVEVHEFAGPHPAGTAGVHIHTIAPVSRARTVWTIGYQDVAAIGHLFDKGELDVRRVISLGGPVLKQPRLLRTRLGASIDDMLPASELQDGLAEGDYRQVSGSVLSGKTAQGHIFGHLGRFHYQVSVLKEGREREFLGWLAPGSDKFSIIPTFISVLTGGGKRFAMNTSTNGSPRAMVPSGMYERVMPMDILPTFLLRSMMVGDVEEAEKLGILELDEEDLALCTFVCPGKMNYGPVLRANLTTIEKEG
jgi:Na+-transporting NADH:ubiquinone oxidoreductase subunit A